MSFVTALVLQQNTSVYLSPAGINVQKTAGVSSNYITGVGLLAPIPDPPNGAIIDWDAWAIPTNDHGLVTGWTFLPYNLLDPTQNNPPNIQAFAVCRIWNRLTGDDWVFVGTSAQYLTAVNGGASLPQAFAAGAYQVGCTVICQQNSAGQYFQEVALPALTGNNRYFPYGYFNGVAFTAASATGYTTPALLLAFLNAVWTNVGPIAGVVQATLLWSLSADNNTLTVVETANGTGADTICVAIGQVNPSL